MKSNQYSAREFKPQNHAKKGFNYPRFTWAMVAFLIVGMVVMVGVNAVNAATAEPICSVIELPTTGK